MAASNPRTLRVTASRMWSMDQSVWTCLENFGSSSGGTIVWELPWEGRSLQFFHLVLWPGMKKWSLLESVCKEVPTKTSRSKTRLRRFSECRLHLLVSSRAIVPGSPCNGEGRQPLMFVDTRGLYMDIMGVPTISQRDLPISIIFRKKSTRCNIRQKK